MHSGDMQDSRSLAYLVHNRRPRADLAYDSRSTNPRRDCSHLHRNRSRNRRT
jgi:hypothetical protein